MEYFTRAGLTFDVTDSGPTDGEVIILLHGWPQDRHAFDRLIPLLTAAGYRALAFDQRGYSPGAQPKPLAAYAMAELVEDVIALADAVPAERVHLVGHDWGGAVAWAVAERFPDKLASLTVLSTPHPRAMAAAWQHPEQLAKSWYMLAFQAPVLPELVLRSTLGIVLRRSGLDAEDADGYAARFRRPGRASGGLAWYRAMGLSEVKHLGKSLRRNATTDSGGDSLITVPTTFVWGNQDVALGRHAATETARWVSGDYRFVELEAGHWLPETRPHDVASAILHRTRGERAPRGNG
ncbi:alpha/beta fold hydrolase [Nostocoides sp. HKS02]|uniref:alpha/beta fold hydrolase n=1 Tax=Nostocoides sp. HKS02 TaxID=1813880 RepID=UPI001E4BDC85|nr:alpha/beta fold hydrolase [Tetrasphaera sp. HKS02]